MIRKKNGQALVEFVFILPVLIFLIFLIIDFGKIIYTKSHLENRASDIIELLEEEKTYDEIVEWINKDNSYKIKLSLDYHSDQYVTVKLEGEIPLVTPGINLILGNPYGVVVKRVVPYE